MALRIATPEADLRLVVNENTDEVELRLQNVETIAYLRDGEGAPSGYNEGDFYIDTLTYDLYKKELGVWNKRTTLRGPQGSRGLIPRGVWNSGTEYAVDNSVSYRGSYWRAIAVNTNVEPTSSAVGTWEVVFQGNYNAGVWFSGASYRVNDIVRYAGTSYMVLSDHVASTTPNISANYGSMVLGLTRRGEWSNAAQYGLQDIVTHRGSLWVAERANTNVEPKDSNSADWGKIAAGIYNAGEWTAPTQYRVDDHVTYRGSLYVVVADHASITGNTPDITPGYYRLAVEKGKTVEHRGAWDSGTEYELQDIISYRGHLWRALQDNINVEPNEANAATWERSVQGVNSLGIWTTGTTYRKYDQVTHDGNRYSILNDHIASTTPAVDTANYQLIVRKGVGIPTGPGSEGQLLKFINGDLAYVDEIITARASTVDPSGYPIGSSFFTVPANTAGYPASKGRVVTLKTSNAEALQKHLTDTGIDSVRAWESGAWTTWLGSGGGSGDAWDQAGTIQSNETVIVEAGRQLIRAGELDVKGTLVIQGTVRII